MQPQLPDDLFKILQNMGDRLQAVEKSLTNDAVPIGALIEWPAASGVLPFNYLPADGRAVDRVAYTTLFAQIGIAHGSGDGVSTFNIPDRSCQIYMDASATRTGCLLLDGTSYLRATYPDLFNALGGAASPWGLPDGTHFNVPDMRGRTAIGVGTAVATGATAHTLGQKVGEETHVLTVAELASHAHNDSYRTVVGGLTGGNLGDTAGTYNELTNRSSDATGSNTAHNNMQPSATFNFFISTTNATVIKVL